MSATQIYTGSCHCGAVRYTVELPPLETVYACNCSMCSRMGWLMAMAPATAFTLVSGEERLRDYRFHTKNIQHLFCDTCGIRSFAKGVDPSGGETVCVNVRCLEGVDADALPVERFDGASA